MYNLKWNKTLKRARVKKGLEEQLEETKRDTRQLIYAIEWYEKCQREKCVVGHEEVSRQKIETEIAKMYIDLEQVESFLDLNVSRSIKKRLDYMEG